MEMSFILEYICAVITLAVKDSHNFHLCQIFCPINNKLTPIHNRKQTKPNIMTNEQKTQVRDALVRYASNFETMTQAAESLHGISAATIAQVRDRNWELLSEKLWYHIARQVGFFCGEWQPADTSAYLLLRILFADAQHYAMTYGVAIGDALGKTFTASHYVRENDEVYYLSAGEDYNRRSFLDALLGTLGLTPAGTIPQKMQQFTNTITDKEEPLLIIDDAQKLKDRVLHLLILLANSVAGKAGIVIMGNDVFRTRMQEGVRLNKTGYEDIYRSIGRRFITLGCLAPRDIELICLANGLHDEQTITHIKATCHNNLHLATRLIQQYNEQRKAA